MVQVWKDRAKKDKPWMGVCCKACWYAKRSKCRCKCGGHNHQKGLVKTPETEDEFKRLVDLKVKDKDLSEQLCLILDRALVQHPEWSKHIEMAKEL